MATLPLDPAYRRVTVREFLAMDLGDAKAELVDGVILMMAGGSPRHAAIAMNLGIALGNRLRGTGCRPYGSDLAVRTGESSIRFPDVSVFCREDEPEDTSEPGLLGTPRVIFEVLSPSTASNDQIRKLAEYRALPGVREVVFVDPDNERVRVVDTSAEREAGWLSPGSEVPLHSLGISLPPGEIFAD
jgi:Uma2 family endonuclease